MQLDRRSGAVEVETQKVILVLLHQDPLQLVADTGIRLGKKLTQRRFAQGVYQRLKLRLQG